MDATKLVVGEPLTSASREEFWQTDVEKVFCASPAYDRLGFGASSEFVTSAFNVLADAKLFEIRNSEIEVEDKSEIIFWGDLDQVDLPALIANHILLMGSKLAFGIQLHGSKAKFAELQEEFDRLRKSFWMDFGDLDYEDISIIDSRLKAQDVGYKTFCDFLASPFISEFRGPLEMMVNARNFSHFFE